MIACLKYANTQIAEKSYLMLFEVILQILIDMNSNNILYTISCTGPDLLANIELSIYFFLAGSQYICCKTAVRMLTSCSDF